MGPYIAYEAGLHTKHFLKSLYCYFHKYPGNTNPTLVKV